MSLRPRILPRPGSVIDAWAIVNLIGKAANRRHAKPLARCGRHDLTEHGSHDPTSDECDARPPQQSALPFCSRRLRPVRKEVKSTSSVVLKTVLPIHLGQPVLLTPSPFRQRFLFLPNSPGRGVPRSPSPRCEQERGPRLPILATVPGAFGQGI